MSIIEITNAYKSFNCGSSWELFFDSYEVEALSGVSISLQSGECLYLTGSSGSGKSVLLNLMAGYYQPDRGKVRLFGQDPARSPKCRSRVSLVRPGPHNFETSISSRQNLRIMAGLYGIPLENRTERIEEALQFVGIDELKQRIPYGELSPGTKNLISIAAGLVNSPDCILLDDPDRYLGSSGSRKIRGLLQGLLQEGTTIVVSTRNSSIVEPIDCRHIELREGEKYEINHSE